MFYLCALDVTLICIDIKVNIGQMFGLTSAYLMPTQVFDVLNQVSNNVPKYCNSEFLKY